MEFIKELGTVALGTRIKNLSESLMRDMVNIYKEQNIDFEPRWFTFFQLILKKKEVSITEIARELNQTHPAVVQVMNVLEKKKLILTNKDKNDSRKRVIKLSKKGRQLAEELAPTWEIVHMVSNEILEESAPDLLDKISKVETVLHNKSTYFRIKEKLIRKAIEKMEFVEYSESYLNDYRQLNEDWLSSYLEISEHDKKILSDPIEQIIKKGGHIFLLLSENEVIGTYTLQRKNHTICELSKFTIKKGFRGWKLGELMLNHTIDKANELNFENIVLFTHPKLKEALQLYIKRGFEITPEYPEIKDKTGRCSLFLQYNIN
ncbi:MAG: bifunctional helix-turn-helix transcriptional regulator/GNAT family N-acetyltransferase [Bacteroidales bacterium]